MKKRLLITSIVMMLVCAVALSTATYAWFTSNATVTASSITMTAATNQESALGIGWIGSLGYEPASNMITADATAGTFLPMVPDTLEINSTKTGQLDDDSTPETNESLQNVVFKGGTVKQVNGAFKFNSGVQTLTPYIFKTTPGGNAEPMSAFFVKNLSNANSVSNLKLVLTWGDDASKYTQVGNEEAFDSNKTYYTLTSGVYTEATGLTEFAENVTYYTRATNKNESLVRVAVFARSAAVRTSLATDAYLLKGVLGKEAGLKTEWGNVQDNGDVADLCANGNEVETVVEVNFGSLTPNQQIDMVVMVWLDGVALNDNTAGSYANVGLEFKVEAASN